MSDNPKDNRVDGKSARNTNKKPLKVSDKKTANASKKRSATTSNKKSTVAKNKKPAAASTKKLLAAGNKRPLAISGNAKALKNGLSLTWVAAIFVAIGLAVLVYARGMHLDDTTALGPKPETVKSATNAAIGGPFSLVDEEGKIVTDIDFRGQYLLVYFGYTYCPDVCHTSLQNIADALGQMGDQAAKITPIFISIDPGRDTPEHLKEYASFFHPRLRALTGKPDQIAAVAKAYRVYYARVKEENPAPEGYLMDHSSAIYLMGPDGIFQSSFPHGTDPETLAERIRKFLS